MGKGYFVDSSDKLLNEKDHSSANWNFQCSFCSSKNVVVHPVGITFRYNKVDVKGLSIDAVKYYKSLPNVAEAVMLCYDNKGDGILVECTSCGRAINGFFNGNDIAVPLKNRLRKYVNESYGINEEFEL